MYPSIFRKGHIGSLTLKNRVVMTSMTTGYAGLDGQPTEQLSSYYEERAKGGVGLIMTEIFRVNNVHGVAFPRQLYALNPMNVQPLAQMVDRVHQYGTKIMAQIHHGGSTNSPEMNGGRIVGPSPIPNVSGIVPDALTLEEIEELKGQFIGTAAACQAAGFDGVELHGAHGYLLCEFLSPAFNKRDDQYGGSLENRCRLIAEMIQGIKAVCGRDFPVGVRFSCDEHDPFHPDSLKLRDGVEIAKCLEAAGADFLDVSNGNYFCPYGENEEPYSYDQGWRAPETRAVKEAVAIPVIGVSNIKSPQVAEKLLEEGVCDFVGLGRSSIADPAWCRKAAQGCDRAIHHCIGCLYCFESLMTVGYVRCSVNPRAGREAALKGAPVCDGGGRKIAVIGGGCAGMEAAAVLGSRGFDVTLYEKDQTLGGELKLAGAAAPYKDKVAWLIDTLESEMEEAGVKVKTGVCADPAMIRETEPEAVFLCAGARPICPDLPGIGSEKVVTAAQVLTEEKKVCGKVLVAGAGLTGLETAEKIFRLGDAESVTVIDMVPQIGAGMYPSIYIDVVHQMEGKPLTLLASRKLKEVTETGIIAENLAEGKDEEIPADFVVLALGNRTDREMIRTWEEAFDRVVCLGQTHKNPGRIATSLTEAYIAARGFDPMA